MLSLIFSVLINIAIAAPTPTKLPQPTAAIPSLKERLQERMKSQKHQASASSSLIFDLPVTYNQRVSHWISYFQGKGKNWFRNWLERSTKYMPFIQKELKASGLPQDLAFMVMIESGFDPNAVSHASAVGPWQFIRATGERYGLRVNQWLDERRDLRKSTLAAIRYLKDLYSEFGSWYLVAASYNMGEGGLRRQIQKYQTKDFWALSKIGALPKETIDYVPKILAVMMISKAPNLYGFGNLAQFDSYDYDVVTVPGGTDMKHIADRIGITHQAMKELNSEILLGYIPHQIERFPVRVPKGAFSVVSEFLQKKH